MPKYQFAYDARLCFDVEADSLQEAREIADCRVCDIEADNAFGKGDDPFYVYLADSDGPDILDDEGNQYHD